MPIRPENLARYPKDWKQISLAVKIAAGWKCEFCGVAHGDRISRGTGENVGTFQDLDGFVFDADTGTKLGRVRLSDYEGARPVKVVLTTAHLDHQPENCERANLKALCQRCHLVYDKHHHAQTRHATRRAAACTADLFEA